MTDDEFWEAVFVTTQYFDEEEYPDPDHDELDDFIGVGKCDVCGSYGACAWDAEGMPLIHPRTGSQE